MKLKDIWKRKSLKQVLKSAEKTALKKNLSSTDLAALGIGAVLGTGIFVSTGVGAHMAGPSVVLSFIVAAITSGLCALTYAELATMFPVAGSTYTYSYIAFGEVSTAAEETINPKRDVPRGLAICLGVVIILYVTVAIVITGMVPFKEISQNNALPDALTQFGVNWGAALVGTGAVIGMISTLLVMLYGQIRVFMVMSRDGLLPKVFSKIHPIHKTPTLCTIITGVIAAAMAGILPLQEIIKLCNIGTLFAFILVSIGVIVLRKTMPNAERKFRVPWVPFIPGLTILACLYLMAALPLTTWIRFIVWLLLGLAIYFLYGRHHSVLQKIKPRQYKNTSD